MPGQFHRHSPDFDRGRSLVPAVKSDAKLRDVVHSELAGHQNKRNFFIMAANQRYRYTYDKLACELYDLEKDHDEMRDLVGDPAYAAIRKDMHKDYIEEFRNRDQQTRYFGGLFVPAAGRHREGGESQCRPLSSTREPEGLRVGAVHPVKALAILLLAWPVQGQIYDLLLKNSHVIDPKNNIDGVMDVAIKSGKIAAVSPNLSPANAARTIDLTGLYSTPGIVDIHTHLFHTTGLRDAWAGDNSIAPDGFSFRTGVTTMVDAGSAGWRTFETFRHTVIDRVQTRVFALINISGLGMMTDAAEQEKSEFKPEEVARVARKHADVVVGVKSAHYQKPDWASVDAAVEAGRLANIPVMVDFGWFLPERPYWQLVTQHLRPGDISTHMFRGPVPWVDDQGKLLPYLREARARGVKFDVGHGNMSLVLRNAAPAIRQGFWPDSISTDLHGESMNAPLIDMPTLLSKFLTLGMPLKEVILRATWNPAQIIHHTELGHLTPGAVADVAVWRLMEGHFGYADAYGGKIDGRERLICELTLRAGAIAWNWNALGATDYRQLGPAYGVREGIDQIIRPK